jgi:hypothetical protein
VDPRRRPPFNAAYSPQLFGLYMSKLESRLGAFPFRVAETPLMLTHALRDQMVDASVEILRQLSEPKLLAELKKIIPAHYAVPGMDPLPNCAQVDFAITQRADGTMEGKVVELQAFPSLYALMVFMADAWAETMNTVPGLRDDWGNFVGLERAPALELLRRTIVADCDPNEVALVDYAPEEQKTSPDFVATQKLFGVDSVCVTRLEKKGRQLFRMKDGKRIQVKRIYNRMVFDELEVKGIRPPFSWNEELDVSWCSHPNWYWPWSKFSLPHVDHPAVPKARFLSSFEELPRDLSRYVLKPLFSYAGSGVVIDVTPEEVAKVPADQRAAWVLQEKIDYAPAIRMPDGNGVKAEVRVMLVRPPDAAELTPLLCLVRLSRGKMLGVDFNKGLDWVGGSVGVWGSSA